MISVLLVAALVVVAIYGVRLVLEQSRWLGGSLVLMSVIGIPLVIWPESANRIANALGVGRGADLLVYLLFFVMVLLILVIHAVLGQVNRQLTQLARQVALLSREKPVNPARDPITGDDKS